MRKKFSLLGCAFILLLSCQQVPITGRQQLSLVPSTEINQMSMNAYQDFLSKHEVVTGTQESEMVKSVGRRIADAVERYFAQNDMSDRLKGFNWEFNLVKDPQVNAFAMPGGKVVVYSGILPVAGNQTGLATVMSHEIAHVVANHGEERMSQGLLTQLGGVALSAALSQQPQATQQLFMGAYGLGSQVGVLLPYSRLQESEADRLGLVFMAMAGYEPQEAVAFWERMMQKKDGGATPEFLSTHPSDQRRISDIQRYLPEAKSYR